MKNFIKNICCLAIITSTHVTNSMFSKSVIGIASALAMIEKPNCYNRIYPVLTQKKVIKHLKDLSDEVAHSKGRDEEIMKISMYDGLNEEEKKEIKDAFTQGLTRMLTLWELVGPAGKTSFCRSYLPHTFFNNYPPFDVYLGSTADLQVDLFLPMRELYLKRLADAFPDTSSHILRYEEHVKERFSPVGTSAQVNVDWHELANTVEDFGIRLRRTAVGIDNPCLTRMRLASRASYLLYNDRR